MTPGAPKWTYRASAVCVLIKMAARQVARFQMSATICEGIDARGRRNQIRDLPATPVKVRLSLDRIPFHDSYFSPAMTESIPSSALEMSLNLPPHTAPSITRPNRWLWPTKRLAEFANCQNREPAAYFFTTLSITRGQICKAIIQWLLKMWQRVVRHGWNPCQYLLQHLDPKRRMEILWTILALYFNIFFNGKPSSSYDLTYSQ